MKIPVLQPAELTSYAGERVRCEVARPRDAAELAEVFSYCRTSGRNATLRSGGHSLDGQALNHDVVILLDALTGLTLDTATTSMSAGAATRWGAVVTEALRHDRMPPVVVSTHEASVGGTLASNSLSRFTPVRGKEIQHVTSLELVTPRGDVLTCSREVHPEVFRGVVGGFGYLGAVTRVELALDRPAPKAVQTQVIGLLPQAELLAGLLAPAPGTGGPRTPTRYSVLMPGLARGLLYESTYLDVPTPWHRYRPVHRPRSLAQLLGQLVFRSKLLTRATWSLAAHTWSRRAYVDPVADFTFFMDGNARLVRLGRRLGLAMRAAEQTFVLPVGAAPASPTGPAAAFLAACTEVFARARLVPALTDVLRIPPDDGVLSSSAQLDGFAATFGFQTSQRKHLDRIRAAFMELAVRCAELGGRVHLTKNVMADPDVLAGMYAGAIPTFHALKQRLDPDRILRNQFLAANFPALVGA